MSRGLIYAWRGEAGQGLSGDGRGAALPDLVPVVVRDAGDEAGPPVPVRKKRRSCPPAATNPDGVIEIVLPGDVRLTVRGRVEGRTLRAVLGALRSA